MQMTLCSMCALQQMLDVCSNEAVVLDIYRSIPKSRLLIELVRVGRMNAMCLMLTSFMLVILDILIRLLPLENLSSVLLLNLHFIDVQCHL